MLCVFVFKQKTAYEMRISDWSSDVCSSDLPNIGTVPWIGGNRRFGAAPKVARTLSCSIMERPKVATIESAAAFLIGRMTKRSITDPISNPKSGTSARASQNSPVTSTTAQATTVPTMKKRSEEHTSELQSLMRTYYAVYH